MSAPSRMPVLPDAIEGEPVAIPPLAWHDRRLMRHVIGDWFFYGGRGPA
ncbi:MAG: hypothetical protein ACRDGP_10125 [Actinomycetota bacterium]